VYLHFDFHVSMSDQYTEVTTKSWGSRLGSSFGAVIGSFLLFIGAFVLLYWNEGRVDISNVAKTAIEAQANSVDAALDGKLISVTGQVTTPEMIGDGMYLKPGNYLGVMRTVEMYAWNQKSSSTSETKLGGSEETKTTYSYEKKWTSSPADSGSFKVPEGHTNPVLTMEGATVQATEASIGSYTIYPNKMDLPGYKTLTLTDDQIIGLGSPETPVAPVAGSGTTLGSGSTLAETATGTAMPSSPGAIRRIDNVLYMGAGSPSNPQIGDIRISYKVLAPGFRGTVFGNQASGGIIEAYASNDGRLYALYEGGREEAIQAMHDSYVMMTWALRVLGFLMMWGGLSGIFAPLTVLLDVLPFLGHVSRGAISFIAFWITLLLSILTIILSMLLHNIVLIIILAVAGLIGAFLWLRVKGKNAMAK